MEPARQKLIYCESGRIGPYFPDFSANRTTMHLQIEKIWPRFPTFSLRSFLPRRLLADSPDPVGFGHFVVLGRRTQRGDLTCALGDLFPGMRTGSMALAHRKSRPGLMVLDHLPVSDGPCQVALGVEVQKAVRGKLGRIDAGLPVDHVFGQEETRRRDGSRSRRS